MNITKFGHSCILIEKDDTRVLIDPGTWSDLGRDLKVDAILITHEHPDHLDLEKIKVLLEINPELKIYTNQQVGKILTENNLAFERLLPEQEIRIKALSVKSFVGQHALIYPGLPRAENTGYLIDQRFFHPGDALMVIPDPIELLAVPIVAPWLTLAQAIDYVKTIKPQKAFPIHDGMLKHFGSILGLPESILATENIKFMVLEPGVRQEL